MEQCRNLVRYLNFDTLFREEKKIAAETMKQFLEKKIESMAQIDPTWKIAGIKSLTGEVLYDEGTSLLGQSCHQQG